MRENILVIGPSWIGDMVMAQCLLQQLKKRFQGSSITLFAPVWTAPLVQCMQECGQFIENPLAHGQLGLIKRYSIAKRLQNQFQRAYILPNTFKSALIPFLAAVPKRIGWRGECRDILLTDTLKDPLCKYPLMVQRYVALVEKDANLWPQSNFQPKLVVPDLVLDNLSAANPEFFRSESPILALCPGAAFGPSKQWLSDRFAEVAEHFLKKHWDVLILGSKQDADIAEQINQRIHFRAKNLCGKTNLLQAIGILSRSNLVVTHDSGSMHIAAALGIPLVALYGSSSPNFTPPLGAKDQIAILNKDVGCNPCFKRKCPKPKHLCMLAIEAQDVILASQKLLAKSVNLIKK